MSYPWTCPFCNRSTTITDNDYSTRTHSFYEAEAGLTTQFIVCPNPECKKFALSATLHDLNGSVQFARWQLKPNSSAKPFPEYVPEVIRSDYEEACLIAELSPKASATLARRCLQGMIRDYWKVKKRNLFEEINAIENEIDSGTYQAIHAVRNVGNIGAHMEKDINLIIDVEPDEAKLLISLIERLMKEWYINAHEREKDLKEIIALANEKAALKKSS